MVQGIKVIITIYANDTFRTGIEHDGACVFTGIGERIREGNELYFEFEEVGILEKVMMAFGQMDEPPGARFNVVLTGITLAEYLESSGREVLLKGSICSTASL